MEARKIEFRNYLETTGAIKALTDVLIKLFDLSEKPEDSVTFIRQNIGDLLNADDENEKLKNDIKLAETRIKELEYLLNIKPDNEPNDDEKRIAILNGYESFQNDIECKSLLKKYLTKVLIDELIDLKTEIFQSTLYDCIKIGLEYHLAPIGLRAADVDCYETFFKLFDPIIREYHQNLPEHFEHPAIDWKSSDTLSISNQNDEFIVECKIFCSRSIESFPFLSKMSADQFQNVMNIIRETLDTINDDEYKGNFYAYETIDNDTKSRLIADHLLFDKTCSLTKISGHYKLWPKGRAVYSSDNKLYAVDINNKNHLAFGCIQKNGDLKQLYQRMIEFSRIFDENISIVRHSRYGFVTARLTLLGNAMRIFAKLKLSKLPMQSDKLNEICVRNFLKISHETKCDDGQWLIDVKSIKCLGLTEFDTMNEFINGINEIINVENEIQ